MTLTRLLRSVLAVWLMLLGLSLVPQPGQAACATPSFAAATNFAAGSGATYVAVGDFNRGGGWKRNYDRLYTRTKRKTLDKDKGDLRAHRASARLYRPGPEHDGSLLEAFRNNVAGIGYISSVCTPCATVAGCLPSGSSCTLEAGCCSCQCVDNGTGPLCQ